MVVRDIGRFNFSEGFQNVQSTGAEIPEGAPVIISGDPASGTRSYDYTVMMAGTYNYYCMVHGDPSGAGMAGFFSASGTLTNTLKLFVVTQDAGKKPLLTRKAVSEQNVDYFSKRKLYRWYAFF